ncbi:MAG: S1 RNA-binding domain-containing protein [Anaerolineae bacterium]|nr:S1 RNA-binding domain-containing protein [Anaerolineae bacterium]
MLTKRSVAAGQMDVPELDEGWWASILADEDACAANMLKNAQGKTTANAGSSSPVDWERVKTYYENDEVIKLEVYGFNRGGVLVRGEFIQGFVPVSHLVELPCGAEGDQRKRVLNNYVGKTLHLKVIECEADQERIVLSERAALAGDGRRRQLFSTLRPGEIVNGTVTNVTEFGVFVDLGGLEGLIHVSELSWGRVQHPAEILKIGDPVRALVLNVSEENGRVALSLKRLCPNPWEVLAQTYQAGDIVEANVTAIRRFGAFARLKEGVEGLIHISTIHLPDSTADLEGFLTPGMLVQVKILHIDTERRRLGLGLVSAE